MGRPAPSRRGSAPHRTIPPEPSGAPAYPSLEDPPNARVRAAAKLVDRRRRRAGARAALLIDTMEFLQPTTWADAVSAKAERPDAVPIAGGTDLMVGLNFGATPPPALLD